ncbi:hypothetical protein ABVT39_005032 [Epinephelus coioides]
MAKLAKINYRNKVGQKLTSGNAREVWQGLNIMMDGAPEPAVVSCLDPAPFAEQLNIFFARFNSNIIDEQQVTSILHRVKPHKASGYLSGCSRTAPLS